MVHAVGNDVSDCRAETFLSRRIIQSIVPQFIPGISNLGLLCHGLQASFCRRQAKQHSVDGLVAVRLFDSLMIHQRTPDLHVADNVIERFSQSPMADVIFPVEYLVR